MNAFQRLCEKYGIDPSKLEMPETWAVYFGAHEDRIDELEKRAGIGFLPRLAVLDGEEGWEHRCDSVLQSVRLWVERCPHCGRPAPSCPAVQPEEGGAA